MLKNWVGSQFPGASFTLESASEDASFRRYFRATFEDRSLMVMDAPPSHEDCAPFIKVSELFYAAGAHVPRVLASDLKHGFLLLDDLGTITYLQALQDGNANRLYLDAIESLIKIQRASRAGVLPAYDEALLLREMRLFPDWYVAKKLRIGLNPGQADVLDSMFERVLQNNIAQPRVYVHRDYHSRNLMVGDPNPGILDFQDAVYGPITYDVVSLFKDAYVCWDEERILDWVVRYWERARKAGLPVAADFAEFYRDFEWMGIQRHLKVLGIFARLYYRDGKEGYLKDLPRVMQYLRKACERYSDFTPLLKLLDELEGRSARVSYNL
ncbi:MAG TPA: phosphotransferase [Burkholderiales bacterium]|nr:phosphotransferase [Burkholderiales bacterium]